MIGTVLIIIIVRKTKVCNYALSVMLRRGSDLRSERIMP